MKSLLLILVMSLVSTSLFSQTPEPVSMTSDERNGFLDGVYHTARGIRNDGKVKYSDYKIEILDIYEDLYLNGYIKLGQFRSVESHYNSISGNNVPVKYMTLGDDTIPHPSVEVQASHVGAKFKDQAVSFLTSFASSKPLCSLRGDMSTTKKCCSGLSLLPFADYQIQNNCTPKYKECSKHEDCCSKKCNKFGDQPGVCASELSCYKENLEGEECPRENPYCESGTSCLSINHTSSGTNDYIPLGGACNSDAECATDRCESGACKEKNICTVCLKQGESDNDKICCPGLYKGLNGICVPTFPPFTLPENVKNNNDTLRQEDIDTVKRILMTIFSKIVPFGNAIAEEGEGCIQYGTSGLTTEPDGGQEKQIADCMNRCTGMNDQEEKKACITTCTQQEQNFLQVNLEAQGEQSATSGCAGGQLTRQDFSDLYNVPAITSKTESDVRECEFNSYNDSWISASNMERNAEITLRAFEAVYSGKGTNDLIIDKRGKSIYERAQKVALKLRENRYELIKSFQELDQKMSCKCLAVFGPTNNFKFKKNNIAVNSIGGTKLMTKKDYFSEYCKADQDYLKEDGLREAEENGGGNRSGLADETAATQDGSGEDEFSTNMAETDKGAVGLSHEKLIVEWLGLKRQVQLDRFQDNSELEEILQELITFIQEYKWISGNDGQHLTKYGEVYQEFLYEFRVTYLPKWLAIVITILAVGYFITLFLIDLLHVAFTGQLIFCGMLAGAIWDNADESNPTLNDIKSGSGCHRRVLGVCITKYDQYKRYLTFPEFDNARISSSVSDDKRCKFHNRPKSCIKSLYRVNFKFNEEMNYQEHPLIDPPMPATQKLSDFNIDETYQGKTFAQMLEWEYQEAIGNGYQDPGNDYGLKATYPKRGWKSGKPHDKKKRYMEKTIIDLVQGEENLVKIFSPLKGTWQPDMFTETMENKFKKAIQNYARCKKLGSSRPECQVYGVEIGTKDVGFGYLYENDSDARDFAEYAYQLHFVWPHLSADDKLGYPTIGQDAYFQSMLYNLKLIGSIALKRSMETYGAYDLYKKSYERRKADYAGLDGAEVGAGSRNVGVGDRVFEKFKGLDFNSKVNMEKFSAQMDGFSKDDSFSESERGLFATASAAFKRRVQDLKKREHYEKEFGSTARGKIKKERSKGFLSKLNSPLSNMSLNVGGRNLGNVSGAATGGGSGSGNSEAKEEKKAPVVASTPSFNYKAPNYGGGSGYNSSSSSSSYEAKDYSKENESGYGDLNNTDVANMLKAAESEDYRANPDDSIFKVVSKAYKRNLSRILVLKSSAIAEGGKVPAVSIDKDKEEITNKEKESLKDLLKKSN